RQKVHLDAPLAFAAAGLAAPTTHVEGEASGLVAALPRFRQHREDVADLREDAGICRRVGPRRPPDRRLVDADDLIHLVDAGYRLVRTRFLPRAIELARQ